MKVRSRSRKEKIEQIEGGEKNQCLFSLTRFFLHSKQTTASSGALLVVLLETHLGAWQALTKSGGGGDDASTTQPPQNNNNNNNISPPALIAAVAAFVGAYELEAEGNGVVILGVHAGEW